MRYLVLVVLVLMRMLLMRAAWVPFLAVRAAAWYLQEEQFEIAVGWFLSLAGLVLSCADAASQFPLVPLDFR